MNTKHANEMPYVVVDCETTGIHPGRHHRVIELALVDVDPTGTPVRSWSSLLRADRDLGPTEIHGIHGRDLRDAPSFEDVLGDVLDRLAGKTVVAHNARFDCGFLESELERSGIDVKPLPWLCTMELATALGVGGARVRLADCGLSLGFTQPEPHCAEADAVACASILAAYLLEHGPAALAQFVCGEPRSRSIWPSSDRRAPCRERHAPVSPPQEPSFLASLVGASDAPLGTDTALVAPYLEVLDRAIEDRQLSGVEQAELAQTARMLNLSASRVRSLHGDYVGMLIALARRDYVITERERHDLVLVGEALGIPEVEELIDRPLRELSAVQQDSLAGKTVCFTGALTCAHKGTQVTRELAQELAEEAGMVVAPRVTKKLDLLVVADPNSTSGKAAKAREYGVRVVAEAAFWPMLDIEVS